MPLAVHFVARNTSVDLIGVDPHQIPLLPGSEDGARRRVVELWDPAANVAVADIVMNERELPEALGLMYAADEVHVHGVVPRVALKMLPQVRIDALEKKTLVVHGPWTGTAEVLNLLGGEAEVPWPGPVRFDALARACWERDQAEGLGDSDATAAKAVVAEDTPTRFFLDVQQPGLLPVDRPPRPIRTDGVHEVRVCLAREYSEAARDKILGQFEGSDVEGVSIQVWHDPRSSVQENLALRRHAHLAVVPLSQYWTTSLSALQTLAQGVPLVVVGDCADLESPPGVEVVADFESLAPIFASCLSCWSRGEAAPLDPQAARAWLLARLVGADDS